MSWWEANWKLYSLPVISCISSFSIIVLFPLTIGDGSSPLACKFLGYWASTRFRSSSSASMLLYIWKSSSIFVWILKRGLFRAPCDDKGAYDPDFLSIDWLSSPWLNLLSYVLDSSYGFVEESLYDSPISSCCLKKLVAGSRASMVDCLPKVC